MMTLKVGVYIDASNIYRNGGRRMQYDVLREFANRDEAELTRMNTYVSFDEDRARQDSEYRSRTNDFHSVLRDFGYKVIIKRVKWYTDDQGDRYGKANADLDLAVDVLLQSDNLDRVLIASGDGDFIQVVRALQNKGCRVEIIACDNVSADLRYEADMFMSAYLIPDLIPTRLDKAWGKIGSVVRGVCYWYSEKQGYGFMRFLETIASGLWLTDTRHPDSPYSTVYFSSSNLRGIDPAILPSHDHIFEFELAKSNHSQGNMEAANIELLSRL